MESRALNQSSLAKAARTTQSTVYRWLTGTQPRAKMLEDLCNALGVSKGWLLRGEGEMDSHSVSQTNILREENEADPLLGLLRDLDFSSLCGVAEASLAKLRGAGQVLPLELKHLSQAVDEIRRRAPQNQAKSYIH